MSRVGSDTTLLRAAVTSGVVEIVGSVVVGTGALVAMALVDVWLLLVTVAAVRPDGHRPQLIEHHARLLAVVVGALAPAG